MTNRRKRSILMTPENAQKAHRMAKTQARLIVKEHAPYLYVEPNFDSRGAVVLRLDPDTGGYTEYWPYGVVGDRLWIRESGWERPTLTPAMMREGADTWEPYYYDALLIPGEAEELKRWGFKRRSSIHMPRWACRTVVELTGVCVERLNDITEEDAYAEGCEEYHWGDESGYCGALSSRSVFVSWWGSIHGQESWEKNPYVWVLSFLRILGQKSKEASCARYSTC